MTKARESRPRWFVVLVLLLVMMAAIPADLRFVGGPGDAAAASPGKLAVVSRIAVTANDLLYDTGRDVIYASIPSGGGTSGNSVVALSRAGEVINAIFVGSEPNVLALSADGRYLYVGIDGAAAFRRVDLEDGTVGPLWPLGYGHCGLFTAEDMVVLVDDPHAVAIARRNSTCSARHEGVAVFDDGVMRPETTQSQSGSNAIEPSADPATLYGYTQDSYDLGVRVLSVGADGITETNVVYGLISEFDIDIHHVDGLIYATDGRVVDPATLTLAGTYAARGPLDVDSGAGTIYFVETSHFGGTELKAFDLDTFLPLFRAPVAPLDGAELDELIGLDADDFIARARDGRVLRLTVIETSTASGQVTMGDGRYALEGITISDDAGHIAETDEHGDFTLTYLPAGTYTLTPSRHGYVFHPASRQITVPPDATGLSFIAAPADMGWWLFLPIVR